MRKRYLTIIGIMMIGMMVSGCGQKSESNAASVKDGKAQNGATYGMEARAPKTTVSESKTTEQITERTADRTTEQIQEKAAETAEDGSIVNRDFEMDDDFSHRTSVENGEMLSREEAMALVLARVDGAGEADVWMELEEDDGHWKYEGEVRYNHREYEFEMNAMNGNIFEWSEESAYD